MSSFGGEEFMCVTDKYGNRMVLYEDGSVDFTPHQGSTIMTSMNMIGTLLKEKTKNARYLDVTKESFGKGHD